MPQSPIDSIHWGSTRWRVRPFTAQTEQFIVDALRKAGALSFSLVAEDDGVIVGHVAISPVEISGGVSEWFGLGQYPFHRSVSGE